MALLFCSESTSQTELPDDVVTSYSASSSDNSVSVAMDGIHAVIAVVADVTGDMNSLQTSDVSVSYRVTSSSAWTSAGVYQVRFQCFLIQYIYLCTIQGNVQCTIS